MGLSRSLALVPCLLLAGAALPAQTPATAVLSGTVVDAGGAPVAGATVRLASLALPSDRVVSTDARGAFRFSLLLAGSYTVQITKEGFASARTQVVLVAGQEFRSSFRLASEAAAACVVEVVASVATVDTTTVTASATFSQERSLNRVCLAPGAAGPGGAPASVRQASAAPNTEAYHALQDNAFRSARRDPLSTFSIDVDTASASNVRRFVEQGQAPPADAVRIEELLNYFTYSYPEPEGKHPFSVATEVFDCPWRPGHRLVRVGLQGRRLRLDQLPPRNLVFLIDVSGSMMEDNKLPLVKRGLIRLCESLRPEDRVALVVYAGNSGLVLDSTPGSEKARVQEALARLEAGGSTHGSAGIRQAYDVARRNFQKGADNRVLLCTDGDFNVGTSDEGSLVRLIEEERRSGVFLTCLGFGMGNLKDATLEQLADKGNGNYAYIDSLKEMEKVFGAGGASLVTIAKDVKLQVEFNPARVQSYRLIGYENRLLAAEDFNDDAKDAGEMNAGHSVTALYEVVPPGADAEVPAVDPLKYQSDERRLARGSRDLLTVKVRYKKPDGFFSRRLEVPVRDEVRPLPEASADSRWAAAVAACGMVLRESPHKGSATLQLAQGLGAAALGEDPGGLRGDWLRLMGSLAGIQGQARALARK
ncbi:MAG: von Willebrand factor type A domain-containing protein [Holophagaceae bacterium]